MQDLSTTLQLSISTVHSTVREEFIYCNECACWVPRCLTEEHKNQHFEIAVSHLQQFKEKVNEFLEPIVRGHEMWVLYFTPQAKQAGMQWKHSTSPTAKKFKVCWSARKVMALALWVTKGVIHIEFMPWGTAVNVNAYCDTLQ
jgi:hypothetical protein